MLQDWTVDWDCKILSALISGTLLVHSLCWIVELSPVRFFFLRNQKRVRYQHLMSDFPPALCALCSVGTYRECTRWWRRRRTLTECVWAPLFGTVASRDPHKLFGHLLKMLLLKTSSLQPPCYLFCFSSSDATAPDSCCTPYSSIRSGQMRKVETASGRRSVVRTPVKRYQRGSGWILWLCNVLLQFL